FRFDTRRLSLEGPGGPVEVRAKTLQALTHLIAHRNRFVSRDELMRELWPDVHVTGASVTQCISELRRALDDDPRSPRYIETRVKYGYRFVATLYHKPTEQLEPLPPPPELAAKPGTAPAKGGRGRLVAAGVLLTLLLGAGGAWLLSRSRPTGPVVLALSSTVAPGADEPATTVADAVGSALSEELDKVPGLSVAVAGQEGRARLALEVTSRTLPSGRLEVVGVLRRRPAGRELWGWTWVVPAGSENARATARQIAARVARTIQEPSTR
ncbi:MAG TPA: hypothetical protein ENK19_07575, partial [Acidobacteria bacterium]|nr:hypothetical protein [Acidobacteriota bacterium]